LILEPAEHDTAYTRAQQLDVEIDEQTEGTLESLQAINKPLAPVAALGAVAVSSSNHRDNDIARRASKSCAT
jgi:hypothetical protein